MSDYAEYATEQPNLTPREPLWVTLGRASERPNPTEPQEVFDLSESKCHLLVEGRSTRCLAHHQRHPLKWLTRETFIQTMLTNPAQCCKHCMELV